MIFNLTSADTPGPVGGLEATDITKTTAQLSWLPPENDGGSPILNYIVEKREVDRKTWTKCIEDLKKTSFKVTNMTPGIEYYFRVMACNKYGIGVPQDSPKSYLAVDPISECLHSYPSLMLLCLTYFLLIAALYCFQASRTLQRRWMYWRSQRIVPHWVG